mmetsp:Transcript_21908/g.51667  ORF Transcript_21908/g.51667 Transcript_21908/m.51667 type:complete len:312 (+) Transcript_21908:1062-1997(+)
MRVEQLRYTSLHLTGDVCLDFDETFLFLPLTSKALPDLEEESIRSFAESANSLHAAAIALSTLHFLVALDLSSTTTILDKSALRGIEGHPETSGRNVVDEFRRDDAKVELSRETLSLPFCSKVVARVAVTRTRHPAEPVGEAKIASDPSNSFVSIPRHNFPLISDSSAPSPSSQVIEWSSAFRSTSSKRKLYALERGRSLLLPTISKATVLLLRLPNEKTEAPHNPGDTKGKLERIGPKSEPFDSDRSDDERTQLSSFSLWTMHKDPWLFIVAATSSLPRLSTCFSLYRVTLTSISDSFGTTLTWCERTVI